MYRLEHRLRNEVHRRRQLPPSLCTATCDHRPCDGVHRRQQPLPAVTFVMRSPPSAAATFAMQRHRRPPPARCRPLPTTRTVCVRRALSSATIAFAMMSTTARRHRLLHKPLWDNRLCVVISCKTHGHRRAAQFVHRRRPRPGRDVRRRLGPRPCAFPDECQPESALKKDRGRDRSTQSSHPR
jgi:hypothetical protein